MSLQDNIQEEVINKALLFFKNDKKGYLNLSPRFGKIKTTFGILEKLYNYDCTILIAYPDNKIKDEWIKQGIEWKYDNPNIIYVNFRSLHLYQDKVFDFFVIDEFHKASENQREICHIIMTNDENTYTLGLSGTVTIRTKNEWGIKQIAKYSTDRGVEDGILADYQITVHLTDLDKTVKTPNSKGKMLTEKQKYDNYSFVINKFKEEGRDTKHLALSRNRLSTSSIGKRKKTLQLLDKLKNKRTLVFCGLTEPADALGIPSYHNKSQNDQNFKDFQEGNINHLALANIGAIGVTYYKLESVILSNFVANAESTAQSLSRALKLDFVDKIADLHIICLREKPELDKLKKSLSLFDKNKIKYI